MRKLTKEEYKLALKRFKETKKRGISIKPCVFCKASKFCSDCDSTARELCREYRGISDYEERKLFAIKVLDWLQNDFVNYGVEE